jgi:hypothetical protein
MTSAQIYVYINNVQYKEMQSITVNVDYGEEEIRGIDTPYAQEIAVNKISISGQVNGLRIKQSGGLQGKNMRPLYQDVAAGAYVSIRIQDKTTKEDILYIPQAKITNESHAISTKSTYKLSFGFKGIIPLFALDRS